MAGKYFGLAGVRRHISTLCRKAALYGGLILACAGMSGCGKRQEETSWESMSVGAPDNQVKDTGNGTASAGGSGLYDIRSEVKELFGAEDGAELVFAQYYQGEPVQLRCKWGEDKELGAVANIYLYKEDGSSQLLFEGLADSVNKIIGGIGLLAQDGSLYYIKNQFVRKWDPDGRLVYEKDLGVRARDICQLADGTIVLLADDDKDKFIRAMLMELEADTGNAAGLNNVMLGMGGLGGYYIGIAAGQEGLLVIERSDGICEVDLESGSRRTVMSFQNATIELSSGYGDVTRTMHDFRMLESGEAEILWGEAGATEPGEIPWVNETVSCETLCMVETDRIVLVLRGYSLSDQWLKEQVASFNQSNQVYQVMLDAAGEGVEEEDFARQTSIEMAAGKGPDILYDGVLDSYEQGVMEKGGFVDLQPYVESSIDEEQYFPIAFGSCRQGDALYGINIQIRATGWIMKGEVLGGNETPDVETLVDALLAWPEEGMYGVNCDEEKILRSFLEGSETLWGMIDWEQGVCDFSGELFAKMLQAAKRYPYDWDKDCPILVWEDLFSSFYYFGSSAMQEKTGNVVAGTLFDDGCFAKKQFSGADFAVNVNSAHKEGAWEFISFLLGEEAQLALVDDRDVPVNRIAFEKALKNSLGEVADGKTVDVGAYIMRDGQIKKDQNWHTYSEEDITEEWVEEYRRAMEEVRTIPLRTESILEIICQEAEDYFADRKSAEQVAEIVENRVQLYLDENF